ncbi:MAG: decarboxylating 6-phosphogluconate dehydrogenase [Candidatus Eisenbacteria bacterium]|uniref:Decarboxylating 6-phosphogluconate dehydrogenase n=1 Tax=Eiseniibacteriota bacterium TaxID=2212470 RepID=A0A9D6QJ65_UNCEI|nr:decarboxylating 6-phosphogluconate dehydrogenase [Candidatus Eisenbacteria bacterium]MBI3538881.1 decarboxylating 6-phosphogluconate dehydrogenase [Candidatus Eisenbacteria bacterium]
MEIGFIGLGRMGLNMTDRLVRGGHRVVAFDRNPAAIAEASSRGAAGAASLEALVASLKPPRVLWAMIPAGAPVDDLIAALAPFVAAGDILVDGGNSNYRDSRRRHDALAPRGVTFVDAGVSGGIWGLENGFCMMVGGPPEAIARLAPALDTLAPPEGWLATGAPGSGHFAKMIHNGIEYGLMQSYAEGFEILQSGEYSYDLARLAHLWNRGSVVRSWLLELAELAFEKDPGLERIRGWVEDSGEGRWTVQEAMDRSVPAPVITLALLTRFASRQSDSFRDRMLAALRNEFGGHAVKER